MIMINSTTTGISAPTTLSIPSFTPSLGFGNATGGEDIRPIYHIYIKQWASLRIIELS